MTGAETSSTSPNLPGARILRVVSHPLTILLLVDILVYAYFIPLLGFYWDDLDFVWFFQSYGSRGLADYFEGSRPVLGWLYQLNFAVLRVEPWHWQVFALICRWVCAASLYFLIRQLWGEQHEAALFVGLYFLVYPCFTQHAIAIVYSHFFIIMSCLFFSLGLTLYTIDHRKHRLMLTILAAVLAAVNLLAMEYFFMLELLRPVFIWMRLWTGSSSRKERIRKLLSHWVPFLLIFLGAAIWRGFFFEQQNNRYHFSALEMLKTSPWVGMWQVFLSILKDLWTTVLVCWKVVFTFPGAGEFTAWHTALYIVISAAVAAMLGLFLLRRHSESHTTPEIQCGNKARLLVPGVVALLLAGVPFWLTGLSPTTSFTGSRFALPFLLGSAMVTVSLLMLLIRKKELRRSIFIFFIALAAGAQVRQEVRYLYDWQNLQRFLWQAVWRVPALEPDTVIFSQDLPLKYYTDLSLTAPINMIYAAEPQTDVVSYVFFFPTVRMQQNGLVALTPGQEITHYYPVGEFNGTTEDSLTIFYSPPSCLRLVDPYLESENEALPLVIRQASQVSHLDVIAREAIQNLPGNLLGPEPGYNWCYYFEKADLARQYMDWETIIELGETAFRLNDYSYDLVEYSPFIEGYANMGKWHQAWMLTDRVVDDSPDLHPVLCRLWSRIDYETPDSPQKQETLLLLDEQLSCGFR